MAIVALSSCLVKPQQSFLSPAVGLEVPPDVIGMCSIDFIAIIAVLLLIDRLLFAIGLSCLSLVLISGCLLHCCAAYHLSLWCLGTFR